MTGGLAKMIIIDIKPLTKHKLGMEVVVIFILTRPPGGGNTLYLHSKTNANVLGSFLSLYHRFPFFIPKG